MTRRSKRDLERTLEELERETDTGAVEYDQDPLGTEEKRALADVFDADPWDTDTDAGDALAAIHRRAGTDR